MANVTLGLPESTGVRVFYDNAVSGIQVQSLTSTGNWTGLQKLNISTLNNDSNFLTELDLIELSTAVSGLTSDYKSLTGDVVTVSTNLSTLTENFNVVSSTVSSKIDSISGSVTLLQSDLSTVSGDLSGLATEFEQVSAYLTKNIETVSGDLSGLATEFEQVSAYLTKNINTISSNLLEVSGTVSSLPVEFLSSLTPEQYNVLTDGLNNLWKLEDNNTYSLNIPVSSLPSYLQASYSANNLSAFVTNVIDNMNFATVTPLAEFIGSFDTLSGKLAAGELNNRTIYLVPNDKNSLDEYIVVSSKLELLGPAEINIENYVLKEDGKGLSTNDYTNDDKTKLTSIASGAQVNVIESIKIDGNILPISNKSVDISLSGYALNSSLSSYVLNADLSEVAKTGSYTDLTDKPVIPSSVAQLSDHTNYVLDSDIKTVAKTGSYTDLTDKPTSLSSFTNDIGYITSSAVVAKAKTLETGRTIKLGGVISGSGKFDGSSDLTIDTSFGKDFQVSFNSLTDIPSGKIYNTIDAIKYNDTEFDITNKIADLSELSGLLKLNWNNITNKPALATTGELSEVSSILTGQIKENEEYAQTVSSTLLKDINTISSNLLEVSGTVSALPVEFLSTLIPEQYNVLTGGLNNLWKLEGNEYSLVLPEYLSANSPNVSNLSAFVSGVVNNMGVKIIHPVYEVVLNFDTLKNWCENKQVVDSSGNVGWILNTETIYLVPSEKDSGTYDEYLCIPNANNGVVTGWTLEQIGNTKVDLSGYATLGQISSFITSGDVIARALVADKLSNGRKIDLTGIVSGSAQFDGSKDISINVALADGIAWSDITDIPSGKIYNEIDKIKYNDTEFDITDKTVDLSNLSGVFQVKGDYLASKITSKDYDPNGQLSDIFGSPASQNTTELKVVVPNNVIVGSANKTGIAAIWDTENEEWISLSQSSTNTISEQNADLLPTVSAVIDYVAKHSPTGPTYTEGAGISLTNNTISIKAATSGSLGGVIAGNDISVEGNGDVTVLQANKVKNKLTINGATFDGSSPVSITAISGVADNSLEIDSTKPTSIKVKISAASDNQLSLKGDGLYVKLPEGGSGSSANIVVGEWDGKHPEITSGATGLYFDKTEEIPWIYDGNTKEWFDLSVPPILSSAIEEGVVEPLYIASVGSVISYVNNKFSDKTLSYFSDEPSGNAKNYYVDCIPTVSAVIEYTNEKLSGITLHPGLSGNIITNGIGIAISQISGNALTIKDDGLYVKQSSGSSGGGGKNYSAGNGLYLNEVDDPDQPSIGIDLSVSELLKTPGVPQIATFAGWSNDEEYGSNSLFVPASVVPLSNLSEDKTPYKNMIAVSGNNTAIYLDGTPSGKQLGIPVVDNINPTETDISETVPTVEAVIKYVGNNAGGGNSGGNENPGSTENVTAGVSSLIFIIPDILDDEYATLEINDLYNETTVSASINSITPGMILDDLSLTAGSNEIYSSFSSKTLKVALIDNLSGLTDYKYRWKMTKYNPDNLENIEYTEYTEYSDFAYGSVYGIINPKLPTISDITSPDGNTLLDIINSLQARITELENPAK